MSKHTYCRASSTIIMAQRLRQIAGMIESGEYEVDFVHEENMIDLSKISPKPDQRIRLTVQYIDRCDPQKCLVWDLGKPIDEEDLYGGT